MLIAELTNTPYVKLLSDVEDINVDNLEYRNRIFNEENMYTRMRTYALSENLKETYQALPYMREKHLGQFRKKGKYNQELVKYINHPLLMACHAHALGIRDDALLAGILLHDVVEDTNTSLEELPFNDEVKELVRLLTIVVPDGKTKKDVKEDYYNEIKKNPKASVIKILDRCNNVSLMAGAFTKEKMLDYIDETEKYIIPLMTELDKNNLEYSNLVFIVKYQIISIIETIKNLIME
jgi:GTP pyrophosphokinase